MINRVIDCFFMIALLLALSACSSSSEDELAQWIVTQKSQTHPSVKPLSEPKQFKPETYSQMAEVEPFSSQKLTLALKKDSADTTSSGALVAPELARRKETLEEFPLDTLAMVGHMVRGGKPVALVSVNKLLYQVRIGEHVGQHYGLVTRISETEVTLREIVQDAAGEWIERTTLLSLQERSK